jgi:PAS domain-containing protein
VASEEEPARDSMFEAALVALETPVIIHGPTTILFANTAACRVLKAPDSSALIGTPITAIVHSDAAEAGRQRRRLVLEHKQTLCDVPVKLTALDGTTVYVRANAKHIEWAGEAAILISATVQEG